MKIESNLINELIDQLLSKIISHATKTDMTVGNIVILEKRLRKGVGLLDYHQQLKLVSKVISKGIFKSILNFGKNTDEKVDDLCYNILLFSRNGALNTILVSRFLEDFIKGGSRSLVDDLEQVGLGEKVIENFTGGTKEISDTSIDAHSTYYEENYGPQLFGDRNKKKLGLSNHEAKYLNKIWSYNNSFIKIEQCSEESVRLYLHLVEKFEKIYEDRGMDFFKTLKALDLAANSGYYNERNYNFEISWMAPVSQRLLEGVFKIAENCIREHYRHSRKRDEASAYEYFDEVLNMKLESFLSGVIDIYSSKIATPTETTLLKLNELNRARWKDDFKTIKSEVKSLSPKELVLKTNQLIAENKTNPSLSSIYFEATKMFAGINKIEALKYYLQYRSIKMEGEKMKTKELPKTIAKKLFTKEIHLERFNKLLFDVSMGSLAMEAALGELSKVYAIERKKVKLNEREIDRINETHKETVETLNVILEEEDSGGEEKVEEQIVKPVTPVIEAKEESLEDIFGASSDNEQTGTIDFEPVQIELLKFIYNENMSLSDEQVSKFAKEKRKFKGRLVNGINELFYEEYEEVLIEAEDGAYTLNKDYVNLVENL